MLAIRCRYVIWEMETLEMEQWRRQMLIDVWRDEPSSGGHPRLLLPTLALRRWPFSSLTCLKIYNSLLFSSLTVTSIYVVDIPSHASAPHGFFL